MNCTFDAAASTAPTESVQRAVNRFLSSYGSIHRGSGDRSLASSRAYEAARETVLKHVHASRRETAVFTTNTTDAIRVLASAFPTGNVLISDIEHSANDLPWRNAGWSVSRFNTVNGIIVPELLEQYLKNNKTPQLVSITGASNITGQIVDLLQIYKICKRFGVPLFADCSQRMAHAPTLIGEHCDALAFSGHKIHAPFGAGALAAPKEWLKTNNTSSIGGGSVVYVYADQIFQKPPPYNWESGTPNGVGAIAIAQALKDIDYDAIQRQENLIETWYHKYVIPYIENDVLWCNGALLMLRIKERFLTQLNGLEFRYGAFCCYEAFRRIYGEPEIYGGALPKYWGGLRLASDPLFTTEEDIRELGARFVH